MMIQTEKSRAEGKCRIHKDPDIIIFEKKGKVISLRLNHLIYYPISKLEEAIEELKDSLLWEELEAVKIARKQ